MIFRKIKSPYQRYGILAMLGIFLIVFLFVGSVYLGAWGKIPSKAELSSFEYQRATEVYTADSILIEKYFLYDRQPIPFEQFPEQLVQALVSIEDERFYDHSGVDATSLLRVGIKSVLLQDRSSGGGSTLTQQLAKNLYPRRDRKKSNLVVHKIKEMIMASRLDECFSWGKHGF